jgi:hypothetical protein
MLKVLTLDMQKQKCGASEVRSVVMLGKDVGLVGIRMRGGSIPPELTKHIDEIVDHPGRLRLVDAVHVRCHTINFAWRGNIRAWV